MPGFSISGEGNGPASLAEVRRTHRWVFSSIGPEQLLNKDIRLVLKTASRPSVAFEEPPMHHNQEQIYFAGKHTWEPLSLSWYDVEQPTNVSKAMFDWIEYCLQLHDGGGAGGDGTKAADVSHPRTYKAQDNYLDMLDGVGTRNERWEVYNGWPQSVNWNALDYSSSDLQLIEVKFRFDRAKRTE